MNAHGVGPSRSRFVMPPEQVQALTRAQRRRRAGLVAQFRRFLEDSRAARADVATRPTPRGWAGPGAGRVTYVAGPVEAQGTTVQVCGLWPFSAGTSSPIVGVPLGRHLITGASVCADPVFWFLANLVSNPSCFVLGRPGLGKSTLVRRMVTVLSAWGVTPMVLSDLKPDYVDLIKALDGLVIGVGRGRGHINPLDMGPLYGLLATLPAAQAGVALAELRGRRLTTFTGLLAQVRGDRLAAHENNLVSAALRLLDERTASDPSTPAHLPRDVYDLLVEGPEQLRSIAMDRGDEGRYRDRIEPLLDLIGSLSGDGPFGDLFAGHTTTPIELDRAVVFDLSSIDDGDLALQAAAQSVCWSYGSLTVSAAKHLADAGLEPQRHYFMVMDELWRMLRAAPFMVDFVDALTRLNRNRGLGQAMITHTMDDLKLPTETDTAKAWGFVERSSMVFCGGLAVSEMGNLQDVFAMSGKEQSMIGDWSTDGGHDPDTGMAADPPGLGKFLLKLGKKPGVPFHVELTPVEKDVNNTNHMWSGMAARVTAAREHAAPDVDDAEQATRRSIDLSDGDVPAGETPDGQAA